MALLCVPLQKVWKSMERKKQIPSFIHTFVGQDEVTATDRSLDLVLRWIQGSGSTLTFGMWVYKSYVHNVPVWLQQLDMLLSSFFFVDYVFFLAHGKFRVVTALHWKMAVDALTVLPLCPDIPASPHPLSTSAPPRLLSPALRHRSPALSYKHLSVGHQLDSARVRGRPSHVAFLPVLAFIAYAHGKSPAPRSTRRVLDAPLAGERARDFSYVV